MGLFAKNKDKKLKNIARDAAKNESYNTKLGLLGNCLKYFSAGDPEPFRHFLAGYFELKNMLGKIKQPADTVIDEGFATLVAVPVLDLLEKSQEPLNVLLQIIENMPEFYKGLTTQIVLRHAQKENKWPSAQKMLETASGLFDDTGYAGPAAKVEECAKTDTPAVNKNKLVAGSLRSFEEGNPEHLQAFLAGYLEYKRLLGDIDKLSKEGVDDGLVNLVSRPLSLLIEKSKDPQKAIAGITGNQSAFYRQLTLDLVLRYSCHSGMSWYVVDAVLQAGADPNTGGGRAIINAIKDGDERVMGLLHKYGGDFKTLPAVAQPDFREAFDAAARKVANTLSKPDAAPMEKQAAPAATPSVKKLSL